MEAMPTFRERMWAWFQAHARSPHVLVWLAVISFTDALFFPIAPELFLIVLVLAHRERSRTYLAVAAGASAIGAATGYVLATFLFREFGEPVIAFYHLESAFAAARHIIAGHVFITMAVASFTPIPDKVFIYAGGFLGVHFLPFWLGYVLGRTARMGAIVYLTERYGAATLDIMRRYALLSGAILVALATIYAMVHWHLLGL